MKKKKTNQTCFSIETKLILFKVKFRFTPVFNYPQLPIKGFYCNDCDPSSKLQKVNGFHWDNQESLL